VTPPLQSTCPLPKARGLCSQRDDVSIGHLHRDGQRVLLLLVQGVLVCPSLQEQADLAVGGGAC
jgi:hypothetical protein